MNDLDPFHKIKQGLNIYISNTEILILCVYIPFYLEQGFQGM